jgi:hypothetical protein
MANKVTIYLDIMRGNSFVKQIPYLRSGFLTKIDGNPEQILDAHEVEEYVYSKLPHLRGQDIRIEFSNQPIINH